jgi:hypothetical protein
MVNAPWKIICGVLIRHRLAQQIDQMALMGLAFTLLAKHDASLTILLSFTTNYNLQMSCIEHLNILHSKISKYNNKICLKKDFGQTPTN